jgi:hypothetical protein
MAMYWVKIKVSGANINKVKKDLEAAFPDEVYQVEKINLNPSRADRLAKGEELAGEAKDIVEDLREELESWHGLQGSSKGEEIQDAVDQLQELGDALESLDFGSVSFP